MNIVWIVADTFRRDHLGAYGNDHIRTPVLDGLAASGVRFDSHYAAAFPTMPTRADHFTGRWTMSFMAWMPFDDEVTTLGNILSDNGVHTAAVVDTPFYWRHGFNYDRGFQTYFTVQGQEGSPTRVQRIGHHESRDVVAWWRKESDRNVAQTMIRAGDWLERHYKEQFFLYVDTWDPHEPWDAPAYYTELYMPDYDGEVVQPLYGHWQDQPGFTEAKVNKALATYRGEVTMVDTWVGYLLRKIENMGLADDTAVIFTTDHGFYFGEHGGLFGKMNFATRPEGGLYKHGDPDSEWDHSPLFEEIVRLPLLIRVPGYGAGSYSGMSSAVDMMPTALDLFDLPAPDWVEGRSLLPAMADADTAGRDFVVSTVPFANKGSEIRSVDNVSRPLNVAVATTVTSNNWSLIYSVEPGLSKLYDLGSDPAQGNDLIASRPEMARELHQKLVRFMHETNLPRDLLEPRLELRL